MRRAQHLTVTFRFAVLCTLVSLAPMLGCGGSDGKMAVFDILPRTADLAGDQLVDIHGKNFRKDIGYTVYFGTHRAESVTILNDGTLRVRTPRVEDKGSVTVTVLADNGPGFKVTGAFSFVDEDGGGGANPERGNLRF